MNKKETRELLARIRNDEWCKAKIIQIVESRAILDKVDLVKTRVWWLLSRDFLANRNIWERKAFLEYLISKFSIEDFDKSEKEIDSKLNSLHNQTDWIVLEYLIIDLLSRYYNKVSKYRLKKWPEELDLKYKSDFILSYLYSWKTFNIWTQITTVDSEKFLNRKKESVISVVESLDRAKDGMFFMKHTLDSLCFVQLNWIFTQYVWKWIKPLNNAFRSWANGWYKWNIEDYIENEEFLLECYRFCELFAFLVDNFFKIAKIAINKSIQINSKIYWPNWENIEVNYYKNEEKIVFQVYDKEVFLFDIIFYLNKKLIVKINQAIDKNNK